MLWLQTGKCEEKSGNLVQEATQEEMGRVVVIEVLYLVFIPAACHFLYHPSQPSRPSLQETRSVHLFPANIARSSSEWYLLTFGRQNPLVHDWSEAWRYHVHFISQAYWILLMNSQYASKYWSQIYDYIKLIKCFNLYILRNLLLRLFFCDDPDR